MISPNLRRLLQSRRRGDPPDRDTHGWLGQFICATSAVARRARRRRSTLRPRSATRLRARHDPCGHRGLAVHDLRRWPLDRARRNGDGGERHRCCWRRRPRLSGRPIGSVRTVRAGLVTVPETEAGRVLAKMRGCEVPCVRIGTTGGDTIAIAGEAPVSNELADLARALVAGLYGREGGVSRLHKLTAPSLPRGFGARRASAPN